MSSKALNRSLEAKLAALDGPEWDSSDEEDAPAVVSPAADSKVQKKSKKKRPQGDLVVTKNKEQQGSSVIYLGHLPLAFEERELKSFLSQFGKVEKVRVSRSKKTANPKGYAFVQFHDAKVASIVAETMSGYFLMEKRLVCHVLPQEKVHPRMFHGGRNFKKIDWRGLHRDQVNKPRSTEKMKQITARLISREKKKRQKLREMGIEYDFPGYNNEASIASSSTAEEEEKSAKKDGGKKKKRKMSHDESSNDHEVSTAKSSKKKRKDSGTSLEDIVVESKGVAAKKTPKKGAATIKAVSQTEVKKKKKKEKEKKRRASVP